MIPLINTWYSECKIYECLC